MEPDSQSKTAAMLRQVVAGETYGAVAAAHGLSRTAVERRVKALALRLHREIGIEGLNEEGVGFVGRLRHCAAAVNAALDRYATRQARHAAGAARRRQAERTLTDGEIALAVSRTAARSACPHRDVALLYILLATGARPLEVARMEVRDYLNMDGSVRETSVMRADVAVNHRERPLFFVSAKANEAINGWLAERRRRGLSAIALSVYRGLDPHSKLFLTEAGAPFQIVCHGENGHLHFLCRPILDVYRKILRRTGIAGVSALNLRRTVAARLFMRGATEEQIGEVLGIGEAKAVRELLPDLHRPLEAIMRDLV